jgi:polar amino acid transport system substrate-binding protein
MRTPSRVALLAAVVALAAAACGGGAATPSANQTGAGSPSTAVSPSAASCAPDALETKTEGILTIGTDNPAFPPYFLPREGGNVEPWDQEQGDPTTGEGFESAVAYAVAEELGFSDDEVEWIVVPFANSFAPGPKEFDFNINQVEFKEERAQGADLSEGYYFGNQTVVVNEDGDFADATTITELKDATFGVQVATTSFDAIEDVIQPNTETMVYNNNDDAIEALQNGTVQAIVVDLPTSSFITNVQAEGTVAIGQLGEEAGATPGEYSLVLEKDSPLTDCVNAAIAALHEDGTLADLEEEWLADIQVPELGP